MNRLPEGWWVLPGLFVVITFLLLVLWIHNTASIDIPKEIETRDPGVKYECYSYKIIEQEFTEVPCK